MWQFTGPVFFLVGVGYGVDRWLGSKPWGMVAGGLLGGGVGFYAFIRATNRLLSQSKAEKQQTPKQDDPREP